MITDCFHSITLIHPQSIESITIMFDPHFGTHPQGSFYSLSMQLTQQYVWHTAAGWLQEQRSEGQVDVFLVCVWASDIKLQTAQQKKKIQWCIWESTQFGWSLYHPLMANCLHWQCSIKQPSCCSMVTAVLIMGGNFRMRVFCAILKINKPRRWKATTLKHTISLQSTFMTQLNWLDGHKYKVAELDLQ